MGSKTAAVPYFDVFVNGIQLKAYASKVQIFQETNSHPVAILDVLYIGSGSVQGTKGTRLAWRYLPEQTPIQINYGMKPSYLSAFLGYVASYTLIKSGTDVGYNGLIATHVQYTIVGASQVMQSTVNYAWKHTTPSGIASAIAAKNGFRAIVHPYTSAIDYRLQNISDFQFLTQLANEIGFRFYVDNTDLYFVNPKLILDNTNTRNVPQFWTYNTPGLWDTVRSFKPIVGTITPDGGIVANRTIAGINPNTGNLVNNAQSYQLFSSPNANAVSPTITKFYNAAPADSYYEAQQKVQADINRNMYWLTADAELRGDYRVKPNTLIQLGGNAMPATEAGFWLVQSSNHVLTMPPPTGSQVTGDYCLYAELVRDQVYTATATTPATVAPAIQIIPSVLLNGSWKSKNVGAQIYAT